MVLDPNRTLARAEETMRRLAGTPEARRAASRRWRRRGQDVGRRLKRMAIADLLLLVLALFYGAFVGPLGIEGLMLLFLALPLVSLLMLMLPTGMSVGTAAELATAEPAALPPRVEEWIDRQRLALPSAACSRLDGIGLQLEVLQPQLQRVDARDPTAQEVKRLLVDHLPELVEHYQRVPEAARLQHGGRDIDRQLLDGLGVIESELKRLSGELAADDLKAFKTQGRFLELRYGEENGIKR
jgi:hypothetical protein